MAEFKYVKGSASDFEGHSDAVLYIRVRSDNGFKFGTTGEPSGTDWLSRIIAQRERVAEAYDHLNDFPLVSEKYPNRDVVNHPSHYTQGGIECIDAIKAATVGKEPMEAVCVANIVKYLWRYEEKNGLEDVKKARWYLERLIKEMEE